MQVHEAQQEVRSVYLAGFPGQLVSGIVWLVSAAIGTWGSPRNAILALIIGGSFIFLLTMAMLRVMGRPTSLSPGNPMRGLAMQVAFTVPLAIPLVLAATLHRLEWFYPAFMIVVGAHYLPFIFLYGMREFGLLAGVLVGAGFVIGRYVGGPFSLGGWLAGLILVGFSLVCLAVAREERRQPALPQ